MKKKFKKIKVLGLVAFLAFSIFVISGNADARENNERKSQNNFYQGSNYQIIGEDPSGLYLGDYSSDLYYSDSTYSRDSRDRGQKDFYCNKVNDGVCPWDYYYSNANRNYKYDYVDDYYPYALNSVAAEWKKYCRDSDRDGYGDSKCCKMARTPISGYVMNNRDCNDRNSRIHPFAEERCDRCDNNCNGRIDDRCSRR